WPSPPSCQRRRGLIARRRLIQIGASYRRSTYALPCFGGSPACKFATPPICVLAVRLANGSLPLPDIAIRVMCSSATIRWVVTGTCASRCSGTKSCRVSGICDSSTRESHRVCGTYLYATVGCENGFHRFAMYGSQLYSVTGVYTVL